MARQIYVTRSYEMTEGKAIILNPTSLQPETIDFEVWGKHNAKDALELVRIEHPTACMVTELKVTEYVFRKTLEDFLNGAEKLPARGYKEDEDTES